MHEDDSAPSKSALKRQMNALQAIGEELVGLSPRQLERIPIASEELLKAIREAQTIRSNSARRRHMQLIGKLMRNVDAEPIELALSALHQQRRNETDAFHELETLRDRLLSRDPDAMEAILQRFPAADRQQLRHLLLQYEREQSSGKPNTAGRKLFRYLRELAETN